LWRGLVAAWVPSFGRTGSKLFDVSGNGYHGTMVGAVEKWVRANNPRNPGYALQFDGTTGNYIELNAPQKMQTIPFDGHDFTISSWARLSSLTGDQVILGWGTSASQYIEHRYDVGNVEWDLDMNAGGAQYARYTQSDPVVGKWDHVLSLREGTAIRIYVNGVLGAITDTVGTIATAAGLTWNIGRLGTYSRYFNGHVQDVLVYDRALKVREIHDIHQDPTKMFRVRTSQFKAPAAAPAGGVSYVVGGGIFVT